MSIVIEEFAFAKPPPEFKGDVYKWYYGMTRRQLQKLRADIWANQAFKCAHCGNEIGIPFRPGSLHLHHRDHNPRNNQRYNVEVVCPRCHAVDHGRPALNQPELNPSLQKALSAFEIQLRDKGHSDPQMGAIELIQNILNTNN